MNLAAPQLLEHDLSGFFPGRRQIGVVHDDARTGIPAQNGIIVAGQPLVQRLFVSAHRLPEPVVGQWA